MKEVGAHMAILHISEKKQLKFKIYHPKICKNIRHSVADLGSGASDPGWEKIRIRDEHPR
jgi:hypothetical protein